MKWLLAALASLVFCTSTMAAVNLGAQPLSRSDMQRAPQTAVIMTQCNLLVAGYFTLQDGRLVKLDQSLQAQFPDVNEVLAWGDTAIHGSERVDAECANPYQQTADKTAPADAPPPATEMYIRLLLCGKPIGLIVGSPTGLQIIPAEGNDQWPGINKALEALRKADPKRYVDYELHQNCLET